MNYINIPKRTKITKVKKQKIEIKLSETQE